MTKRAIDQALEKALIPEKEGMTGDVNARINLMRKLASYCRKINHKKGLVKVLFQLSTDLATKGESDEVPVTIKEGIIIASELGSEEDTANFYNQLGLHYTNVGQFENAKECFIQAMQINRNLALTDNIAAVLHNLALNASKYGDTLTFAESENELQEILPLVQSLHVRTSCLNSLGVWYFNDFAYEKALEVLEESVALSDKAGYDIMSVRSRKWIALCNLEMGNIALAKHNFDLTETLCRINNYDRDLSDALRGQARVLIKGGNVFAARTKLEEAIQIMTAFPGLPLQMVRLDIVRVLIAEKKCAEAVRVAEEARMEFEKNGALLNLIGAYMACIEAYISTGESDKAIACHNLLRRTERRLFDDKFRVSSNAAKARIELEHHKNSARLLTLKAEQYELELALKTSSLATQTEMLGNFRNELRQIVREVNEPIAALKKIKEKLKELPCESVDWTKFEKEFTAVHPEFRANLAERYPELTKQEIKMCQLARLGLKTYEMSRLLCLSERTIDGHRNNLRKKLGIKPQENLKDFLQRIR